MACNRRAALTPCRFRRCRPRRFRGITLVELLVSIGVLVLLVALLMPALAAVRSAARRTQCGNNLKQLALATQHFHMANETVPTYWGYFPTTGPRRLHGSWIVHILPYLEQATSHARMAAGPATTVTETITQVLITPASPDYKPGYWQDNGGRWETRTIEVTDHVGHTWTRTERVWVGPPRTWVPPVGTPPVYETTRTTVQKVEAWEALSLPVLRCAADPSEIPGDRMVLWRSGKPWSLANYQANLHAFVPLRRNAAGSFSLVSNAWQSPLPFAALRDGLSNVILLAEGMRQCDGTFRFAWWSDYRWQHSHNFGIDWHGVINTYMFQNAPARTGCNNWRVQGLHGSGLEVAMADGSVRTIEPGIARRELTDPDIDGVKTGHDPRMGTVDGVWDLLLMPRDGNAVAALP